MVSKQGREFEKAHTGVFKTHSNTEADRVIERWNYRGKMNNESNVKYNYYIISYKRAVMSEWDNPRIPFRTESNC
jgi:hypothetical protein